MAKKRDEVLRVLATIDFYEIESKPLYYIRNRKEIVEKLYKFRSDRHISKKLISDALDVWLDLFRIWWSTFAVTFVVINAGCPGITIVLETKFPSGSFTVVSVVILSSLIASLI